MWQTRGGQDWKQLWSCPTVMTWQQRWQWELLGCGKKIFARHEFIHFRRQVVSWWRGTMFTVQPFPKCDPKRIFQKDLKNTVLSKKNQTRALGDINPQTHISEFPGIGLPYLDSEKQEALLVWILWYAVVRKNYLLPIWYSDLTGCLHCIRQL